MSLSTKQNTLTFTFHAGALVSGQVKSYIEKVCSQQGLSCEIKKFGGWLSSDYGVTITGDGEKLQYVAPLLESSLKQMAG